MTRPPRGLLARLLAVGLVILAGCAGGGGSSISDPATTRASPTPSPAASENATETPARPPDLDSRLYDLVTAENRAAFAAEQGLAYENGSVQAVIELAPGRSLPSGFEVTVELRNGDLVQGYVAVDDLVGLARHENVTAVRPPSRPQPA